MKIAFVTNLYAHYVQLLFKLLGERHDVDFYFTGGYETYWNKKNKLVQAGKQDKQLKGFFLTPKFKISPGLLELFDKKYELVIKTVDDRFALLFSFLTAKTLGRPFVLWTGLWAHPTTGIHRLTRGLMEFIYRHCDAIIVYGAHVQKYLLSIGVSSQRLFCAPHSVDNDLFNKPVTHQEKESLRKDLGLTQGKAILFVGRLETCKGLSYLVDALERIRWPDLNIIFIGNGPEKKRLEQRCQILLGKYFFLDHVPNEELYRYYALADIFVLPSITTKDFKEPWGLVVNEAMNQGCPVIATDAVGAAAGGLVADGVNGYIVPEKNSNALKEAIEKILTNDELRAVMRQNSREMIKQWAPEQTLRGFVQAIDFVHPLKE